MDYSEIIQASVSDEVAVKDKPLQVFDFGRGGVTTWKRSPRKVIKIGIPMADGAEARTVRLHELLHANHDAPATKGESEKYPDIALQAIGDCYVHGQWWNVDRMPLPANRDCLAVGLRDLRTTIAMRDVIKRNPQLRGIALLQALRGMAIYNRLQRKAIGKGSVNAAMRLVKNLREAIGEDVVSELNLIYQLVADTRKIGARKRKRQALERFTALLETSPLGDDKGNGKGKGEESSGDKVPVEMRIVELPRIAPCDVRIRKTIACRAGSRINPTRLARAVATGVMGGLFLRHRLIPGGTVLIDASGSMDLDDSRLLELCLRFPGQQVAYYSNYKPFGNRDSHGTLVIFAKGGRRATKIEQRDGGNSVDRAAIEWLLTQPGPRTIVTDGGFCEGMEGQDRAAHVLLNGAMEAGQIKLIRNLDDLGV